MAVGEATRSAPPQHAQPLYNSTNSDSMTTAPSQVKSNPYNSPSNKRGLAQAQSTDRVPSSHQPIVRTSPGDAITPIANLTLYSTRWTLRARVSNKSDIKTWSNAKGEGRLFSIELRDSSGSDVKGTFFRDAVDQYYGLLEKDKVYQVSGGKLKIANPQWNHCSCPFEITFDSQTEITLVDDDGTVGTQVNYEFTKIADIANKDANALVDLCAVVTDVGEVATIISRKTGQELTKCDITCVDDSNASINMTLWRDDAANAPQTFSKAPIVTCFRRAKVSEYNGRSLGLGSSMQVAPTNVPEASALQAWWDRTGCQSVGAMKTLSSSGGGGSKMPNLNELKGLSCIKEENLGFSHTGSDDGYKGDYFGAKATITFIKKDREGGAWYPACSNADEPCKNRYKVTQTSDGQWHCDKCQQVSPNCVRRWIFSIVLEDATGQTWASLFNEQAEQLLGMSADDAYRKSHPEDLGGDSMDQNAYDSLFCDSQYSEWYVRCKVKNERVSDDDSRVKTTVMNMWPVDYVQESKGMLTAIESF